jgi:hypothetical protein
MYFEFEQALDEMFWSSIVTDESLKAIAVFP